MLKYSLIFVIGMFWGYLNLIGLQIVVAIKLNHPFDPFGRRKVSYHLIYCSTSNNMTQQYHISRTTKYIITFPDRCNMFFLNLTPNRFSVCQKTSLPMKKLLRTMNYSFHISYMTICWFEIEMKNTFYRIKIHFFCNMSFPFCVCF